MHVTYQFDLGYMKWYLLQVLLIFALFFLGGSWATTPMPDAFAASLAIVMVLGHVYSTYRIHLSSVGARCWHRCLLLVIPVILMTITTLFTVFWITGSEKPLV